MPEKNKQLATFAGGCFWCMDNPFRKLPGVTEVLSGYMGGHMANPTYEQVCTGQTGHLEVVQVVFDIKSIAYEALLEVFWQQIDPTDAGGQFADRGSQYLTAIFYHDDNQKQLAEISQQNLEMAGVFASPIVTEILPAQTFYRAEEHHQNFCRKQPEHYEAYRKGSGREAFIQKTWL